MVQVIIDSGSTKADWRILSNHENVRAFQTEGYNPYFTTQEEIRDSITRKVKPLLADLTIGQIYFYGAGCASGQRKQQVHSALKECFVDATVFVETDLLGSARALLRNEPGFIAILGTGTNTGIYDGTSIISSVDSAGYFLGDEGSGAYLGKLILRSWLRKSFPPSLNEKFSQFCKLGRDDIFDHLYHRPFPNRFLAGFAHFAAENLIFKEIEQLVEISFDDFLSQIVMHYKGYENFLLYATGSIGFVFQQVLEASCIRQNIKLGAVVQSPVDDLVKYHLSTGS